jgi:hypothetical protein
VPDGSLRAEAPAAQHHVQAVRERARGSACVAPRHRRHRAQASERRAAHARPSPFCVCPLALARARATLGTVSCLLVCRTECGSTHAVPPRGCAVDTQRSVVCAGLVAGAGPPVRLRASVEWAGCCGRAGFLKQSGCAAVACCRAARRNCLPPPPDRQGVLVLAAGCRCARGTACG